MSATGIAFVGIQLNKVDEPHLTQQLGTRALAQHAKQMLRQVPMGPNEKKSYNHNKHLYHVSSDAQSNKYLVVTPDDFNRITAFECIDQVKRAFNMYKSDLARLDEEVMRLAHKYSDPNANKIAQVREQVREAKVVMADNVDKILERGERIEDVCHETGRLTEESNRFQKRSTALKHAMWKKKIIYIVAGVVVFLIIAFVVILLACRESGDGKSTINWDKCYKK